MKILVNYADEPWKPAQHYATKKAYSVGKVDKVIEYGPEDIDEDFRKENAGAFIQNNKRIGKYGLWRPHILMDALNQAQDGDYIIYCDSGAYFVKPVDILIEFMEEKNTPILLFDNYSKESEYTKRDIFVFMGLDSKEYSETRQRVSTYFIVKKNEYTMKFFTEWLQLALDAPFLFTDEDNKLGSENYIDFKDTRHNQSVLSLLSKKYKLPAYRNPSQLGYGKGIFRRARNRFVIFRGEYPTVFFLHRHKKVTAFAIMSIYFQIYFPRTFDLVNKLRKKS